MVEKALGNIDKLLSTALAKKIHQIASAI